MPATFRRDVDRDVTQAAKRAGTRGGQEIGDGLEKGAAQGIRKGVDKGADKAGPAAGKRISAGVSAGMSDGKISGRLSGFLSAGVKSFGPAAAGAAIGVALIKGVGGAMEKESATAKLGAQLGLDPKQAKEFGAIAGRVYAGAWGSSLGEVSGAVRLVSQNIANIADEGSEGVELMTQKVLDLAATFEVDLGTATRGVGQLLKTGLAKNAGEAMDIIAAGFTSGVDKSEDFLDTLNEYGTQFRKLGLSGATATGILSQGLKAGARDADVVADSLKEFSIRAVDGSKLTADGFKALGLAGKTMSSDIAKGGPRAAAALQLTLDRLRGVKDPAKQAQIAVALFGTQAEDMGKALFSIDPKSAVNALGQVAGAAEKMGKTLNDTDQVRIESFKRGVMSKLTTAGGAILKMFGDVAANPDVQNFLGDVKRVLDENVLPALRRFGTWVQEKIVPLLRQFGQGLKEQAIENFHKLQRLFKENEPELRQLYEGFKTFAEIMATRVAPAMIKFYFGALKPTIDFIANVGIPTVGFLIRYFLNGMKIVLTGVSVFLDGMIKMSGVMRLIPGPIGKIWQTVYDKSRVARKGVDDVRDALNRVPKKTTAAVVADTGQANSAIRNLQNQLNALVRRQYSAVISGRLDYFGKPIVGRAMGGPVPGPGRPGSGDDTIIAAKTGEWVTPVDKTRRYLPLLKAITSGTLPMFATGGLVGAPWRVRATADVSGASAVAANVARSGQLVGLGGGLNLGTSGTSAVANILAIARGFYAGARLSTGGGYRPGDPGYHGRGWAADLIGGGAAGMARMARGFYGISGRLLELIHSGGGGYFVKNGRRVGPAYYRSVIGSHYNHVHVAKRANADSGADLMPGWNPPLYNGTGAVERLRPIGSGVTVMPGAVQMVLNVAADLDAGKFRAIAEDVANKAMDRLLVVVEMGAPA